MVEAVIFDMDGLLIDSEPSWKKAEQKAFMKVGIKLSDELCSQTTGYDILDVIRHWHKMSPWNKEKHTFEELYENIHNYFLGFVTTESVLKEGTEYILDFFEQRNIPKSVASSSSLELIHQLLDTFNLTKRFSFISSSQSEEFGKPHPGVYLSSLKKMNINPLHCIAFEDSFYGILAAKAARIRTIAVLEPEYYSQTRFDFADLKLESLKKFTSKHFDYLNS